MPRPTHEQMSTDSAFYNVGCGWTGEPLRELLRVELPHFPAEETADPISFTGLTSRAAI